MTNWPPLLIMLFSFPFLLSEVFLAWSQRVRRRLRARMRARMSDAEWQEYQERVSDS